MGIWPECARAVDGGCRLDRTIGTLPGPIKYRLTETDRVPEKSERHGEKVKKIRCTAPQRTVCTVGLLILCQSPTPSPPVLRVLTV